MVQVPGHYPPNPQMPKPPRQPNYKFYWELIFIPLVLYLLYYLLRRTNFGYSFDDLLSLLNVRNTEVFRRFFILGCLVVAVVAILRILKRSR